LRIGSPRNAATPGPRYIHLGDVLERNGDLFGTAVNITARLEAIAEPGGIVVSAAVVGKLPASFADLGLKTLKNIEEPQ
jgi:adenylate cyclase